MKSIELLATGIRLGGLWLWFQAYSCLVYMYQAFRYPGSFPPLDLALNVAQIVVLLIIGWLFMRLPISVAKRVMATDISSDEGVQPRGGELQLLVFRAIGVFVLAKAIPDIFYNGIWLIHINKSYSAVNMPDTDNLVIQLIVTLVEIAIGLYLCLGTKGLAKLLNGARTSIRPQTD